MEGKKVTMYGLYFQSKEDTSAASCGWEDIVDFGQMIWWSLEGSLAQWGSAPYSAPSAIVDAMGQMS